MGNSIAVRREGRILTFVWPEEFTHDDARRFVRETVGVLQALTIFPVAVVNDMTAIKLRDTISPTLRRIVTDEFINKERALLRERVCAWSDVTANAMLRNVVRLLSLFAERDYAWDTHATVAEGEAWCRARVPR